MTNTNGLKYFSEVFTALGELKYKMSRLNCENRRLRLALDAIKTETCYSPKHLSVAQDSLIRVNNTAGEALKG